jgi:indolepyruvate ferredoxin oxidoreductase, beta subunit
MSPARTRVVVVGVGGQGSVFIARVLGQAALASGLGVVASELHGMAQRGGVVESTVIIGRAHGPIIPAGEADVLIALEPLEALRALRTTRRGAAAVVGTSPIVPFTVTLGGPPYPAAQAIFERLGAWLGPVVTGDLARLADRAGDRRTIGAVAVGAAAALGALPVSAEILREITVSLAPAGVRELNAAAFDLGLALVPAPLELRQADAEDR